MIDPEPASEDGPAQVLSLGSIGKTMPVIMTQGAVAHIGHCYNGMSSLNMLAGIYQRTGGSLEFVDVYKDESSMPLNWQYMRDIKETYDVSLPFRSSGYMTVLSFKTTISETLAKLISLMLSIRSSRNTTASRPKRKSTIQTASTRFLNYAISYAKRMALPLMSSTISSTIRLGTWLPRERVILMLLFTSWISF